MDTGVNGTFQLGHQECHNPAHHGKLVGCGVNNTKVGGLIPVWASHLRVGLDGPGESWLRILCDPGDWHTRESGSNVTQPAVPPHPFPPTATCIFPPTLDVLAGQRGPTAVAITFLWEETVVGGKEGGKEAAVEARLAWWGAAHTPCCPLKHLLVGKRCLAAQTIPSPTVQHLLWKRAGNVASIHLAGLRILQCCSVC